MQVNVNTDRNIGGSENLTERVEGTVRAALDRFGDRVTRVEVYLSDENSPEKGGGNDMKCVMEARPTGRQPVAVTERAESLDLAIDGAAEKLERLLGGTFDRLDDPKGRTSYAGDQDY